MACKDKKESFVMYASFLEAAECLNGDDFKECVLKLRDYALYGKDLDSENQLIHTILIMAKPNLKAAAERYKRCVKNGNMGKEHGKDGGRPRKDESLEEYHERKRQLKTPRKPLNDDDNGYEDEYGYEDENEDENRNGDIDDYEDVKITVKEKEKVNEKDNWIKEVPSGQGTTRVPTPQLVSSAVSIERSNHSEETAGASNTADAEQEKTSHPNSPAFPSNSAATNTNDAYMQEIRGYLTVMAKYALGIIKLEDFDDVFERAIKCYMEFKGVSKPKAAKAIEQGISNYKEGIQNRLEAERRSQELVAQVVDESDEPF